MPRAREVVVALLAAASLALTVLAACTAVTRPFGTASPEPVPKALAGPAAPDPTTGSLPPYTYGDSFVVNAARTALRSDGDPSADRYSQGIAAWAVGEMASRDGLCTATLVESPSERVAVTAAHCVYHPPSSSRIDYGHRPPGYAELEAFVPGYADDSAPWGSFRIEGAWVDPVWQQTGDARYDVAFLRLSNHDGRTPQSIVGAEPIVFDGAVGDSATVLGYPGPPFDGRSLRRCSTPATEPNPLLHTLELRCRLTAGSSGGPWLTAFDEETGRGLVMGVTGYGNSTDDVLGGTRFGIVAHRLFTEADSDAPHR